VLGGQPQRNQVRNNERECNVRRCELGEGLRAAPATTASLRLRDVAVSALALLTACAHMNYPAASSSAPPVTIQPDSLAFGATVSRREIRLKITVAITNRSGADVYVSPCEYPTESVLHTLEKLVDGQWRTAFAELTFGEEEKPCRIAPGRIYHDTAVVRAPWVPGGMSGGAFAVNSISGTYRGVYGVYRTKAAAELRSSDPGGIFPKDVQVSTPFEVYIAP